MRSVASPPDLNLLHAPPLSAADGISGITGRPLFSTPAGPYVVVLFYGQSQTVNIVEALDSFLTRQRRPATSI